MVDVRLLFPSTFIAAADLHGREVTLTISRLGVGENLRAEGGATVKKHVVYFAEMDKRPESERKKWVLNKTNAKSIARLYGNDTDGWIGKRITLFPTTCQSFGETVDCIRVKTEVPQPQRRAGPKPGAFEDWQAAIDQSDSEEALNAALERIDADARLNDSQKKALRDRAAAVTFEN